MPSFRSKPHLTPSSSTEHILATKVHVQKNFSSSDTTTSTSSAKDSKFSDLDLEAYHAGDVPLPPPPSYQEITTLGPVHSVSGSSWVTEAPTVSEDAAGCGGRKAKKGVVRYGGRGSRRL